MDIFSKIFFENPFVVFIVDGGFFAKLAVRVLFFVSHSETEFRLHIYATENEAVNFNLFYFVG